MATTFSDKPMLLEVRNLIVEFRSRDSVTRAVNDVSLSVRQGETVAVVGESGSGKSVTALALTKLLPSPPAQYLGGKILLEGRDVLPLPQDEMRKIRGRRIAYIFQEPGTSLNPVFTIGYQISEAIQLHRPEVKDVLAEAIRALETVGIREPAKRIHDYPHQLSGGMQQRVMIAMALACRPQLLVADEPTTALDVTIQKQILDLLRQIKKETGMAILLITHNFGIVADIADRIVVMFRGKVVEEGMAARVMAEPKHPYTKALIECVPRLGQKQRRLKTIDYAQFT